jgi:hypothetical protein
MGWMGLYRQLPLLILVVVIVAWLFARRRSGNGR